MRGSAERRKFEEIEWEQKRTALSWSYPLAPYNQRAAGGVETEPRGNLLNDEAVTRRYGWKHSAAGLVGASGFNRTLIRCAPGVISAVGQSWHVFGIGHRNRDCGIGYRNRDCGIGNRDCRERRGATKCPLDWGGDYGETGEHGKHDDGGSRKSNDLWHASKGLASVGMKLFRLEASTWSTSWLRLVRRRGGATNRRQNLPNFSEMFQNPAGIDG
jgi:hypothetical protein